MSWEELQRINKAIKNARSGLNKFGSDNTFFNAELMRLRNEKANLPPEVLRREQIEINTAHLQGVVKQEMVGSLKAQDIKIYRESLQQLHVPDDDIQQIIDSTRTAYRETAQSKVINNLVRKLQESLRDHYDTTGQALRVDVNAVMSGDTTSEEQIQDNVRRAVNLGVAPEALQAKINETLLFSDTEKQSKLNSLTKKVKEYLTNIEFKAELDPSYTVPDDMVQEIQLWEDSEDTELTKSQTDVLRAKRELEICGVADDEITSAIRTT